MTTLENRNRDEHRISGQQIPPKTIIDQTSIFRRTASAIPIRTHRVRTTIITRVETGVWRAYLQYAVSRTYCKEKTPLRPYVASLRCNTRIARNLQNRPVFIAKSIWYMRKVAFIFDQLQTSTSIRPTRGFPTLPWQHTETTMYLCTLSWHRKDGDGATDDLHRT